MAPKSLLEPCPSFCSGKKYVREFESRFVEKGVIQA